MNGQRCRSVGVIGGGTAGYFAALAIKKRFPEIAVTLVESSSVPIIGVGEATTTLMPPFLHADLGLDVAELFRAVRPTFKLGIKFEWGPPGFFTYPFGDADPVEAFAFDGDLRAQSLVSLLMAEDRVPILRGPDGEILSLMPAQKFAYHLDNAPFVRFLADNAARAGIQHVDMTIADVARGEGGVTAVRSADGLELAFDLYVDASGFRSLLLGEALGSPFSSYATSLFCDRAIVATVPQRGPIQPYTTAETMEAGWCWRIPVEGEDHRGYVHASSFLDEDAAIAEMRAKNPGMTEPWIVRFRSGRRRDFWRENVVGVGNAYGFVEPLESTALHMVIVEVAYLLAGIEAMGERSEPAPGGRNHVMNTERHRAHVAFANEAVGSHWDYLRWFLSIHYKFNRRSDSRFWQAARADVDVSGLAPFLEQFGREGPAAAAGAYHAGDPTFGLNGLMMLLLGQRVPTPAPRVALSRAEWDDRSAKRRGVVSRALPQREGLETLRARQDLLADFATGARSWCRRDAERAIVTGRVPIHPRSG